MFKKLLLILFIFCTGCQNKTSKDSNSQIDSIHTKTVATSFPTHLRDTSIVQADCVVFLRPDSVRFESYKEEESAYEADSDFGFWLTDAIDSMKNDKRLRTITSYVTMDRFINVKNCTDCSKLIDRDTIDYGIILISKKRGLQINSGLGAGNYIAVIRDYFK